jgi:MYXO-CTERM domain-containing protein
MDSVITVSPSPIAFPDTPTGTSAADIPVTIHNAGTTAIGIVAITSSDTEFPLTDLPASFPASLGGGGDLGVTAGFTPSGPGMFSALFTVETDETSCATFTVPLTGVGQLPGISVTPFGWDAGLIALGDSEAQQFTVRNTGATTYNVTSVSIDDTTHFTLDASTFPTTLAPDATATFDITAAPLTTGVHTAMVTINTTIPGTPTVTLMVSAEGICIGVGCEPDAGPMVDAGPDATPDEVDGGADACDCRAGGGATLPELSGLALLALVGLFPLLRRRRRR